MYLAHARASIVADDDPLALAQRRVWDAQEIVGGNRKSGRANNPAFGRVKVWMAALVFTERSRDLAAV